MRSFGVVAGVHYNPNSAAGLDIGHGQRFDLHGVSIGLGSGIAEGHNIINRFPVEQHDAEVEPVDAGIDDIPAAALDLDQL
jgi:hypothetical protein